jgi:hypothetical protein
MPSSDRLAHRQIHSRRAVIPMIGPLSPSGEATMELVASRFPHETGASLGDAPMGILVIELTIHLGIQCVNRA